MKWINRFTIADNERAMVFRNNSFEDILQPGKYWMSDVRNQLRIERYDITDPWLIHDLDRFIMTNYQDKVSESFDVFDLAENEVGLVYEDNRLVDVMKPGEFRAYWKGAVSTEVTVINIEDNPEIDRKLVAKLMSNANSTLYRVVMDYIYIVEVPDNNVGLLFIDGELARQLKPGIYGYWSFNRKYNATVIDNRLQMVEVAGQEILTKDRVSVRVNLSASYRITDTETVVTKLMNYKDFLYREIQLTIREVIGTRTLDDLLVEKDQVKQVIEKSIKANALEFGIDIKNIGIKDIILPGEMKEILNQVVEAEKSAEANLIRRREETQATRSLHNTAKMMEGNATLLRLKELEILERVSDRIDQITVYGGLEGVMKDLVKINPVSDNKGN